MNFKAIAFLIILFATKNFIYSQDIVVDNETLADSLNFELILAADSGNSERVLELLSKGADVNAKIDNGISALMYASQNGHYQTVRVLVANGADINATPFSRETALFAAVKNNYEKIVHYLLLKGADPSITNSNGNNPLHYAILYNYYIITDMLLFYKANIETKAWNDLTPLMISVYYKNYTISKLLVEKGADINAVDSYSLTPLMFAAQNGDLDIVKLLVENNADINKINSYNSTAMDIAIKYGYKDIVYYLLRQDSINRNYNNSYKLAIINNQKDIADTLLDMGAKGKFNLYFNKLFFSYGTNFNLRNFMFESKLGIIESKYKIGFDLGILNHYWPKRILVKEESNTYSQLWEKRSLLFCGIEKRMSFSSNVNNQKGIFVGIRGSYTFGNYKGTEKKVDDKFIVSPQIGLYTMGNFVAAKINYEYIDFGIIGIPKHRINLSFMFFINLVKQQSTDRDIYFY